jgi:hypothetical protein
MKASELTDRLRRHYIKPGDEMPGGLFMTEVALGSRRADALYVGFFASRGKRLTGFEIKVARSDWLAELDQPAKAEAWHQHCHQWYVVAPNTDIVRPEELPEGWGLMIPDPNPRTKVRMKIAVRAVIHEREQLPWHVVHALVQKSDSVRMSEVRRARDEIRAGMYDEIEKRVQERVARESNTERLAETIRSQQALIDQMSEILGVTVVAGDWAHGSRITLDQLRSSFSTWLTVDMDAQRALRYRIDSLTVARESIDKALGALNEMPLSAP